MNFLRKLRFWKRRRSDAVTSCDIATATDNLTLETGTQVSSIQMILRCDAGTQVDSNLTCEASTQTSNRNEKPKNRTDGGAADKEQEELKRKIAALEKFLEEKDRHIRQQNGTIQAMKERQRSEIQYIRTKEEMEKRSLLQKIRDMRDEIISLEERRPPKAKRAEPSSEQESLGPGWSHVVRGGRIVKAASPSCHKHATGPVTENSTQNEVTATSRNGRTAKSEPKVTVGPKQAPVIEDHQEKNRSDHTDRREAGGGSNGQQSGNKRHCPNLPSRLQNRNFPPRLQNRNLPPRLQKRK